ncbi:MAG: cytidylate kinase family protein [Bacteroidales bacterium]|nr:cytidylate kinase family protein [Bacteroidales bacterium]MBR5604762.1 cytidylate kinase family protein [Bacteroidales bacterium]
MINITIAGDLGSGKSTVANHLINNINYRIESAGLIFRRLAEQHGMTAKEFNQFIESNPKYDNMVDDTIKEMGEKEENIIFDSRLAWYFVPKSFKIYMYVDVDTATERIFNDRDRISESYSDMATAKKEIIERRQSEVLRYKTFYNVDINNYSNYDFIIDTSHAAKEEVNELVLGSFRAFEQGKEYNKIWLSPKNLIMENEVEDASEDIEIEKRDSKFYVVKGFAKVRAALEEGKSLVAIKKMIE